MDDSQLFENKYRLIHRSPKENKEAKPIVKKLNKDIGKEIEGFIQDKTDIPDYEDYFKTYQKQKEKILEVINKRMVESGRNSFEFNTKEFDEYLFKPQLSKRNNNCIHFLRTLLALEKQHYIKIDNIFCPLIFLRQTRSFIFDYIYFKKFRFINHFRARIKINPENFHKPEVAPDYSWVFWKVGGKWKKFYFGKKAERLVIQLMYADYEKDKSSDPKDLIKVLKEQKPPLTSQATDRLRDIFKTGTKINPAWGKLIKPIQIGKSTFYQFPKIPQ